MKRIAIILSLVLAASALPAQTDTLPDSLSACGNGGRRQVNLTLGVQAGMKFNRTDYTPYDAPHSLLLQIPLVATIPLPVDRLTAIGGLRYDFEWSFLRYNVTRVDGGGIDLLTTPTTGRQTATMFHSYLGLTGEVQWQVVPGNHRALRLGLDYYVAYDVSHYLTIRTLDARNTYFGVLTSSDRTVVESGDPMFQPWKLEVGLTLSTDMLGIIHGVRFFTNLLPTYIDPASGTKIYNTGMMIYL
ncbi:MAG: hypothetical protein IJ524_01835 [Bacteroidales bacterium]|nr:hypothetical protein [Bacteroidales bacterium]